MFASEWQGSPSAADRATSVEALRQQNLESDRCHVFFHVGRGSLIETLPVRGTLVVCFGTRWR